MSDLRRPNTIGGNGRHREDISIWKLCNFEAIPNQVKAWEALHLHQYVLFGGARGGSKSYWLRWSLLMYLIYLWGKYKIKGIRAGLFCETYPDLRDRQISKIILEFPLWLGQLKETKADGYCFHIEDRFGGGKIALRNLDDPSKYQSAEFAAIAVDELTKNPLATFNVLRGSKRWPGIEHTIFLGATNPGSVGHLWVKSMWLDGIFPEELKSRAKEFVFIRSLPEDNPFLPESYWEELNSLPPDLYRAWVLGDWDVFEGQAFTVWDRTAHVIRPRELPSHWYRWRAVDWGFAAPWCCYWFAKDPDIGRIFVYREAYQVGLTDRAQARRILDMTPEEGVSITYADPSMWAKKNVADVVTSTADEYIGEGVPLTRADNDRMAGKRKVDRVLSKLPDGLPGIQIFETCTNLIRTLPALPYDEVNVEDIDTDAEDHPYDTLRYGLTRMKAKKKPPDEHRRRKLSALERIDIL